MAEDWSAVGDLFDEYVRAHWARHVRTVILLGADPHSAEDVVQSALIKCYYKWPRLVRGGDPDAYVHRVLVNTFIDTRRRFWTREVPVRDLSDPHAGRGDSTITRISVLQLLKALPEEQYTVLVLRFYADLSVRQAALALRISEGTVKSRTSRALSTLASQGVRADYLEEPDDCRRGP